MEPQKSVSHVYKNFGSLCSIFAFFLQYFIHKHTHIHNMYNMCVCVCSLYIHIYTYVVLVFLFFFLLFSSSSSYFRIRSSLNVPSTRRHVQFTPKNAAALRRTLHTLARKKKSLETYIHTLYSCYT